MAVCKTKRFARERICAGDLRNRITIQTRTLAAANFDDTDVDETFATVVSTYAAIETIRGTRRFASVNIDKRATHLFYVRYRDAIKDMETGNNFILHNSRRYFILELTIMAEDNRFIIIQATNRGESAEPASEA